MSGSGDSDGGSEPDLETLTRRAAEAKLLAGVRGTGATADSDDEADQPDLHATPAAELLWVAERGLTDRVRGLLLQDAALAHTSDGDGYTPLHRAAYNDHAATARLLLAAGAQVAARTADGWTPLHSAARWNATECLQLLLLHGADVNAATGGGLTPLMVAASSVDARDTCFLLLDTLGVRLDLSNDSGDTAADVAARTVGMRELFEMAEPYMTDI